MINISLSFVDNLFPYVLSFTFGILGYYFSYFLFLPILVLVYLNGQIKNIHSYLIIFIIGILVTKYPILSIYNGIKISESIKKADIIESQISHIQIYDKYNYSLTLKNVQIKNNNDEIILLNKIKIKVNALYDNLQIGYRIRINNVDLSPPSNFFNIERDLNAYGHTYNNPHILSIEYKSFLYRIYNYFDHLLDNVSAPNNVKQIVKVLLLGKSFKIDNDLYKNFQKAGLSHILVISGMHIGIIAFMMLKLICWLLCTSEHIALYYPVKKIACFITIIILTIYLLLTGLSASTERAYIVVCLNLIAIMLDKIAFSMHSLCLAIFIILFFDPDQLFNAGFQLTFLSVISIVNVVHYYQLKYNNPQNIYEKYGIEYYNFPSDKKIKTKTKYGYWWNKIIKYFNLMFIVSFMVALVTNIIGMYHFHTINNYSFIFNIIIIPIVLFIIMPCIIAVMFLGIVGLQQLPFFILTPLINFIIYISDIAAGLPYIYTQINDLNPAFWSISVIFLSMAMMINERFWHVLLLFCMEISIILSLLIKPLVPDIYAIGNHIIINNDKDFSIIRGPYNDFILNKIRSNIKYEPCKDIICKYTVNNYTIGLIKGQSKLKCTPNTDFIIYKNTITNCKTNHTMTFKDSINNINLNLISLISDHYI